MWIFKLEVINFNIYSIACSMIDKLIESLICFLFVKYIIISRDNCEWNHEVKNSKILVLKLGASFECQDYHEYSLNNC